MQGDPNLSAAARIEGIGVVDLTEVEPGQYSGKLAIDKKHQVEDIVVTGLLQDQFGQSVSWIWVRLFQNDDKTQIKQKDTLVFQKKYDRFTNLRGSSALMSV